MISADMSTLLKTLYSERRYRECTPLKQRGGSVYAYVYVIPRVVFLGTSEASTPHVESSQDERGEEEGRRRIPVLTFFGTLINELFQGI